MDRYKRHSDYQKEKLISEHVAEIMDILELEITPSSEGTPKRIAKMLVRELFANRNNNNMEALDDKMKVFPALSHDEVVIKVPFSTLCEHHWLPMLGDVTVTYIPNKSIVGLSKVPRVVNFFSKKPQLQEVLTKEVCDYLADLIKPFSLKVEVEAHHTCVEMRGAETPCVTKTKTEYFDGNDLDED